MDLLSFFKQLLEKQYPPVSPNTAKNYMSDFRHFLDWYEKTYGQPFTVTYFSQEVVQAFYNREGFAPSTKDRQLATLRKFYALLQNEGYNSPNPFPETEIQNMSDLWNIASFKYWLQKEKSSPLTIKNYLSDISGFTQWADTQELIPHDLLASHEVATRYVHYLTHAMKFSQSSINRKLSSLRKYTEYVHLQTPPSQVSKVEVVPPPQSDRSSFSFEKSGKTLEALEAFKVKERQYSSIPPVRLVQKLAQPYNVLEEKMAYLLAQAIPEKRPQLTNTVKKPTTILQKPLFVSLRTKRPQWYTRYHSLSFVRHLHLGILIIVASGIGIYAYIQQTGAFKHQAVLGQQEQKGKILAYSGKLTDTDNKPITNSTSLTFSIYPHATDNNAVMWQEAHEIKPNSDGGFVVELGRKNILPQSLFTESHTLFLGIRVGNDAELLPRQPLANVGFAADAKAVQGLLPITLDPDNTKNVLLALDSSGNLTMGGKANPIFQATGGDFTLQGEALILSTMPGSDGNIMLAPDGNGIIDIRRPIANLDESASASGAVEFADEVSIATDSAHSLLTLHNTGELGDILTIMSRNVKRMVIDNSGYVGIGTSTPSQLVHLAHTDSPTLTIENLSTGAKLDLASLQASAVIGTSSLDSLFFKTNNLSRMVISEDGYVGIGTSNPLAMLDVAGTASISGDLTLAGGVRNIQSANNNNLIIGGNTTGNIILQPLNGQGFVGIATNPEYKLDILDTQATGSAMRIYNASSSTDADGLIVKLGNTSQKVASTNQFISFQTEGLGTVGAIIGNGSNGVTYSTNGIADFAEYLKKDERENMQFGMLMCLTNEGTVTACNQNYSTVVGVASERPAFLGGENLGSRSVAVGLVGQVETLVSTINGPIQAGDPITISSTAGIGTKATGAGMIVGRALESYHGNNPRKILVLVQPTWYTPHTFLTAQGKLVTTQIEPTTLDSVLFEEVANQIMKSTVARRHNEQVTSEAEAIISRIKSGVIETTNMVVSGTMAAKNAVVEQLHITSDNVFINGKHLSEYVASLLSSPDFISPNISTEKISTDFISPLAEDSKISISLENSMLEIKNGKDASASAVATIDNEGNATFNGDVDAQNASLSGSLSANEASLSGALTAQTGNFESASIAGTLTADSIRANTIEGLDEKVASIASNLLYSQTEQQRGQNPTLSETERAITPSFTTGNWTVESDNYINLATLSAQFALFHENLLSLGTTTLREATVMDQFSIGTQFTFGPDSLDVLGNDLQIQPLRQGGVSFLAGLVHIDSDGNLMVGGDATFAKNVTIMGGLFANIISPLPNADLDIFLPVKNGTESASLNIRNASEMPVFSVNGSGDVYSSGSANFIGDLVASGSAFLSKLNIFSSDAYALNENELVATSSAGTGILKAYKKEVTIRSPHVTAHSLIYITPSTDTENQVLYLLRQSEEGFFTVGVSKPANKDIQFNWIVVN